ncbi:MAG: nucleoside phosphorylase [Halanaerobiales bacterium]
MADNFLPLLKTQSKNIQSKVLVCGDPERAGLIAEKMEDTEEVSHNREYRVINGYYNGKKITVASHGVGASGAAVCFEEVIKAGAEEIIRVGTAGSLNGKITDGDIVIATGAVREDGLTERLVDMSYPALANFEIINKLMHCSVRMKLPTNKGIVLTVAAFYPELNGLPNNYFSNVGVLAVDMEASALFVISSLHGVKAGAVLAVDGMAVDFDADKYNPHRDLVDKAIDDEIKLALEAITIK